MLGYPTQALAQIHKALALACELAHPFSHAFALDFVAIVHQLRREEDVMREQLDALLRLAHEQGFGQFLLAGAILKGWTLAEQGQRREGIALMRDNLARAHALGAAIGRPYYLALLAEMLAAAGEINAGLQLLDEALTDIHCSSEYNPELYRLKGELTLQKESKSQGLQPTVTNFHSLNPDPRGEAERYFSQAITLAQQQQAKSLELRAVLSLSRLWRQQRKRQKAHHLLANTYLWFTEGFDTKDLQEAKTLLDNLATHAPSLRKETPR
jgi:predicted ATPase